MRQVRNHRYEGARRKTERENLEGLTSHRVGLAVQPARGELGIGNATTAVSRIAIQVRAGHNFQPTV